MIRTLRARHRRTVLILALLVGALLVAGLAARHSVPAMDTALETLVGR